MKISKKLIAAMRTDTAKGLNRKREQTELLTRCEETIGFLEDLAQKVKSRDNGELDSNPAVDKVSFSQTAEPGNPDNLVAYVEYGTSMSYVETGIADLSPNARDIQIDIDGRLKDSKLSLVDKPDEGTTEYRANHQSDGAIKILKGQDESGDPEYEVFTGSTRIWWHDLTGW